MPWGVLVDGVLWLVPLTFSLFLARLVLRRRDLPARLLLAMVAVALLLQLRHFILSAATLSAWLCPQISGDQALRFLQALWPLDLAAMVLFACLVLHFSLVFPTERRVVRAWRWSPLLFYLPGLVLAAMTITRLGFAVQDNQAFWGLDGLGLQEGTLQLLFIIFAVGAALVGLTVSRFSIASAVVRQQLSHILLGLVIGGGLVLAIDYVPAVLSLPRPAGVVPGLRQWPFLIILGAFALSIRQYPLFDVGKVASAISSSLDLEQVLQTIVDSVVRVVNGDKSAIFELSEDGSKLSLRMSKGLSLDYVERSRHLSVGADNRSLAVASGQPLIVSDIRAEPRLAELVDLAVQEGYRAVVDVPLVGREGCLGVLSVYFKRVHRPSPSELEVLTTFANQAAIAIENARLYAAATGERDRAKQLYEQTDAALARRLDELTTIEQISRQLTSTLDLQEVMQLVMERVLQATQAARGVIALYEPPRNALKLLIETGYPAELERYRTEPWPDSRGITGRVARTGRSAMVPDVTQDADYAPITATTRSQLSVPIVYEGQVIGVITLESEQPAAFTEEHLRFAELVAGHAAIGINNARLFEKVVDGRDRLQAILNSTQDVVIVFDMEGRVILSNPRVSDLFGREVGDWLRSAHVLDIARMVDGVSETADLDIECLKRTLRQVRDCPDKVIDVAFSYRDGDKRVYVQGMVSPVVGAKGNAIGRVAVLRDVTHQQELVRFREDLTSMVIHNLQGPLAAVISSLETLNELEPDDDAMADELLGIALGSGRKLYSRIESVLWLRRLEDRQWPLERLSLPLSQVVQPVLDEYQSMAVRRRVALTASLAADVQVYVDEDIIGRVFSNLVDNALKYTPPGGQIRVRATREVDEGQPVALCSVADTGVGITKDAQASIFDRFRRFVRPEAGEPKGMGIGLHYCRLAVEAHGGQIWVESEEGKGCTFYLTLPMAGDQRH